MQVLRGEYKNRKLIVPRGIRPVSLRVKKSLFDVLRDSVPGSRVLDLFAGSGSLGIEALSLGASEAVFVDKDRFSQKAVRANLLALKTGEKARFLARDALKAIKDFHASGESFDLILLDPPYSLGLARKALQTIDEYDILSTLGLIAESCFYKDETIPDYRHFSRVYSKQYGQTRIVIYQKKDEKNTLSGDI